MLFFGKRFPLKKEKSETQIDDYHFVWNANGETNLSMLSTKVLLFSFCIAFIIGTCIERKRQQQKNEQTLRLYQMHYQSTHPSLSLINDVNELHDSSSWIICHPLRTYSAVLSGGKAPCIKRVVNIFLTNGRWYWYYWVLWWSEKLSTFTCTNFDEKHLVICSH